MLPQFFSPWTNEAIVANAITRSIDNPVPWPDWTASFVFKNAIDYFLTRTPYKPFHESIPASDGIVHLPIAMQYRFSTAGRLTPNIAATPWRAELARFAVPSRYFGIVRSLEQYLGYLKAGTPTSVVSFGDPFSDQNAGVQGRWYCVLYPWDGTERPWINQINPAPYRDGIPYPLFEEQSGLWYPAHSDSANSIRLIVPGGYELSLFWECDGTNTEIPIVGAAFKGCIQSAVSDSAQNHFFTQW